MSAIRDKVIELAEKAGVRPAQAVGVAKADVEGGGRHWLPRTELPSSARVSDLDPAELTHINGVMMPQQVVAIPDGFSVMPAGTRRRLRINKDWLKGQPGGYAWIVADVDAEGFEDAPWFFQEVMVLGVGRTLTEQLKHKVNICGREYEQTQFRAYLETEAALLVK
jgi:hypothetical protein